MAYQFVRIRIVAGAMVTAALLGSCNERVASMSCERLAAEAKETSQGQPYKINGITNLREVSRNDQEARCQGNAAWSDNTTSEVYLRAYRQGDNTMVGYSDQGFDNMATTPQAAPRAQ
jgi:hypothetical protein